MQRIDENTYIDDTLVTCAEYQLFIDEMRKQRKYYQPDHWTSYQFPEGKAREPVLGARLNDARAFCGWLAVQGDGEWYYRLPTSVEAEKYFLKVSNEFPVGYWIDEKEGWDFFWANPDYFFYPRNLNIDSDTIINTLNVPLDDEEGLKEEIYFDLNDAQNAAIGIDTFFNHQSMGPKLGLQIDRGPARNLVGALDYVCDLLRNAPIIRRADIDFAVNLYIEIFTIMERIAGRSPAFEGIRLVKERIK